MDDLITFEPMKLIEIDVKNGDGAMLRRLVMVGQSGQEYMDLMDDPVPITHPIYASLNPEEVGNPVGWSIVLFQNHGEEIYRKFGHLEEILATFGYDHLTYLRALYLAKTTLNFDPVALLNHGKAETKSAWDARLGFS